MPARNRAAQRRDGDAARFGGGMFGGRAGQFLARETPRAGQAFETLAGSLPTSAMSETTKAKKTVLIIDDERAIRRLVGRILQLDGFHPVEAQNALDGITLARQYQPDLVICDVVMDSADGYSVLEALR